MADRPPASYGLREQERGQLRLKLAFIRGHLDGYADALALTDSVDKGMLVKSLRKDAAALGDRAEALDG